ncbi:hypothetical protein NE562_17470 [Butyricicoccus faecihominis]|uniref:hypothetical protein n=1 Tax=Butyricicoccus faecihominis TaxID=1712515 RepID=UPI00247ABF19|nr:hypothetical protein [Butyricicoccus faecihominis]MCQ5131445.1 hypothetical protein [Butyricicoccus faecihominis]
MPESIHLPRIRSAQEALREIQQADPNTALKLYHLQRLMKSGTVPTLRAGNRLFVNLDMLIEYIATHPDLDLTDEHTVDGIRAISE